MVAIEARADFDNKRVVLVDMAGDERYAPGAILSHVTIVPDSEGAIFQGLLRETVSDNYAPRGVQWRTATLTRAGEVVDRRSQRKLRSCDAVIIKAGTVYYLGE